MSVIQDTIAVAKLAILTGGSYWFELTSDMASKTMVILFVISSVGSLEWYGRRKYGKE